MKFVKIVFKNNYDTLSMKGNRPLLRAYQKNDIKHFWEGDIPFVLGYESNGVVYELLTRYPLLSSEYEEIDTRSLEKILSQCDSNELRKVSTILSVLLNGEKVDLEFPITTMEEGAMDRSIQFNAYENGLTDINPYDDHYIRCYSINEINNYGINALINQIDNNKSRKR